MWGSDYPHGDSVFPDSQGVLDRIMADCTPDERYAMTAKNVVDLYDLPFEA
jgi:predicted TIM-barrel fold metal-dependent hydrolase